MPLSCEPCRDRKIRCPTRTSYGNGPCETCIRRGIPPSDCIYLRDVLGRRGSTRPRRSRSPYQSTEDSELVERINRLEKLLESRVNAQDAPDHERADVNPLPSPESTRDATVPSSSPTFADASPYGCLVRTESGHERFVPSIARSSSALRGNPFTRQLEPGFDNYAAEPEMPFSTAKKTREDFLATLPPQSQCDRVKNIYFTVYAPVSPLPSPGVPCRESWF